MISHHASQSRSLAAIAWLAVGIAGGLLLARGPRWIAGGNNSSPVSRNPGAEIAGISGDSRPTRSKRNTSDALVSITPEQLSKLASGGAPVLSLRVMVASANEFSSQGTVQEGKWDESLGLQLADLCAMLSFTPEESEKLRGILKENVRNLMNLERTSLTIRETRPGTLEFDFDALAKDRRPIMEDLRIRLRAAFGGRALQDLEILAGLDDFIGRPGESENVELVFEHLPDSWKIWTIAPEPGGREASFITMKNPASYQDAVIAALATRNMGRLAHLKDRLPTELSPPP